MEIVEIENNEIVAAKRILGVLEGMNVGEKSRALAFVRAIISDECGCKYNDD